MKRIALFLFISVPSISFGQDQIIDLYDSLPPHSTGIESEEEWVGFRVSNVQKPQLYIYRANPKNNTGAAVIFCPGGGYRRLAIHKMGKNYADFFHEMGVTTVILKYRLPISEDLINNNAVPFTDVTRAMKLVRSMASSLAIDPDKIGIMGNSAGGHLASTLSTHFDEELIPSPNTLWSEISSKPAFSILVYPVISMDTAIAHMGSRKNLLGDNPSDQLQNWFSSEKNVTESTPPTFIVHGFNDESVSVMNSIKYYESLVKMEVKSEMHLFQEGAHGSGFGKAGDPWSSWKKLCRVWMKKYVLSEE